MKKLTLSLILLLTASILNAKYIPYNDLISGKYKLTYTAGFYTDNYEPVPKKTILFYKNSYDKGTKYIRLLISNKLLNELSKYPDYKKHLHSEGGIEIKTNKWISDGFLMIPPKMAPNFVQKEYWFENTKARMKDFTCKPTGINFMLIKDSQRCYGNKLSDLFKRR